MKLERNLIYALFAVIIACGVTLVCLLGYQYSIVRNELDELIALKAEYQSYVVSLKQLNLEVEQEVSEATLQKKKISRSPFYCGQ